MQLIRGLNNLSQFSKQEKFSGCVATIGNFDGVHIAHSHILQNLVQSATELNTQSMVISFVPNPAKFFGKNIQNISSFKEKYTLLKDNGVDILLLIHFNIAFANIAPQDFIDNILISALGVKQLFIGDDFRFGKGRSGDFELLKKSLKVCNIDEFLFQNLRVSSSNIRKLLSGGDFEMANKMLGREFQICGKVITGKKLGRTISFPTANIALNNQNPPLLGVYATSIIIDDKRYKSIANIGIKPTIDITKKLSLEVHIFDFNQDIYGKKVCIIFKKKIRDEKKFNSLEKLKEQIIKDCKKVQDR